VGKEVVAVMNRGNIADKLLRSIPASETTEAQFDLAHTI